MVVPACNPSYSGGRGRRTEFQASLDNVSKTLPQNPNKNKRAKK
jgi:hypothetical protein